MPRLTPFRLVFTLLAGLAGARCSGSTSSATTTSPSTPTTTTTTTSTSLPAIYARFGGSATVSLQNSTITITTTDLPDHKSPYWGVGNANYEAPAVGVVVNPNKIAAQNIVFKIPLTPSATTPSDTPLGAMGVATNGVLLFNQYAAGRQPLTTEIISFDQYNGHPQATNQYHYHFEPVWMTNAKGKSTVIGVLLDGYAVYGTQDQNGNTPTDLDSCNGHTTATADYPQGIYHYHVTTASPYIAGCFHGSPGTVTG